MDRIHIAKIIILHHKASSNSKSSRQSEKRKTKEHTELGIGGKHQKNKEHLATTGKESPEQSRLENPSRWLMIHEE